jgi:tetrathionate reductase subunit C
MPILFLASAMVSGTGLLIILLPIFQKFFTDFKRIDMAMMQRLALLLSWFVVIRWAVSLFKLEDEVKVQVEWC